MKDLEKLLASLKEKGFDDDAIELVKGHSEHLQSLNATARDEAKNSRLTAKSLQTKIDDLSLKMEESIKGGTSEEKLMMKKLEKNLEEVNKKLEEAEKEKADAKSKSLKIELDSKIRDTLSSVGVENDKFLKSLTKALRSEFKADSSGEFVAEDGSNMKDFIGKYLEGEDQFLGNKLPSGAGTRFAGDTTKQNVKLTSRKEKDDAMISEIESVFNKG